LIIDLNEKKKLADVQTEEGAEGIDISPDEKEVWVTNRSANTISIISTSEFQSSRYSGIKEPDDLGYSRELVQ